MLTLEELVTFCKLRGFVYQSSVLYGGLRGFFDYGPLGVELKNNIKKFWWKEIVLLRDDVFGMDCSNVINKEVLFFSGHQNNFQDIFIDCKTCKHRFRDDEAANLRDAKSTVSLTDLKQQPQVETFKIHCPKCESTNLSESRNFKLMMSVNVGPVEGEYACLRPETAQSLFINFKNITDSFAPKLPFGLAQIGKAYRNEVTPRNFIFRSREFEQMEMEFFVHPNTAEQFFFEWRELRKNWWNKMGLEVILKDQKQEELAHYSKATSDILFKFPHGYDEVEGIANRGDFDLGSHTKGQKNFDIKSKVMKNTKSTEKLSYNENGVSFLPHVVEVSAGVDRAFLAILFNALRKEDGRLILKLPIFLAPIKVAVLPLMKNNKEMYDFAKKLVQILKEANIFPVTFEASSNVGKIYKKQDEVGTPFCVTVDFETFSEENKDTVTMRHRDTMKQERLHIKDLVEYFKNVF